MIIYLVLSSNSKPNIYYDLSNLYSGFNLTFNVKRIIAILVAILGLQILYIIKLNVYVSMFLCAYLSVCLSMGAGRIFFGRGRGKSCIVILIFQCIFFFQKILIYQIPEEILSAPIVLFCLFISL